ncbi:MAG: hypothetical protein RDU24_12155 [Humidesulfovibrio sp.]|uniref:hypothetical protein n=1 Tax=Humidesulfovibrio sp. TaxID=2910988 RepID=UPI0027FF6205|nr:hypothetical protein [Humidesulfovibrio sp.]MDQ7836128.1 hypothetical protein [Humidesulfovibrio sp.]
MFTTPVGCAWTNSHDGRQWWMFAYLEGRTPVGLTSSQDMYFILADQLGTPVALATTDGGIAQVMQYAPFGGFRPGASRRPDGEVDPLGKKGGDSDWHVYYSIDGQLNGLDACCAHLARKSSDAEQKPHAPPPGGLLAATMNPLSMPLDEPRRLM